MRGDERRLAAADADRRGSEALDGHDVGAAALDGEQQAGTRGGAIIKDGAHAANTVLTAQVGAGQAEVLADGVGESHPRRDRDSRLRSVHRECNGQQLIGGGPDGVCLATRPELRGHDQIAGPAAAFW